MLLSERPLTFFSNLYASLRLFNELSVLQKNGHIPDDKLDFYKKNHFCSYTCVLLQSLPEVFTE